MHKFLWVLLCLLPLGASAGATDKPSEIARVIHADTPYGHGTYSWLMINAYDATLWTDASPWSWDDPFALALHYRMHFASADIVKRSLSEMQDIEPLTPQEVTDYTAQLGKLFPEVSDGDVITALYIPDKELIFYYNGKRTGHITDDTFAQRFLSIWLSERTSAPSLRKALLSGPHT